MVRIRWIAMLALAACGGNDDAAAERREYEAMRRQLQQAQVAAEKARGVKVKLSSGEEMDPARATVIVQVAVTGSVAVDGKAMSDRELAAVFHSAFAHDRDSQVMIQADRGVSHTRVVQIMEMAKQAGLTRLAIGTTGGDGP